jgi:non-ribosomal peptide synthetase component F
MIFLALWQAFLHRYSCQDDLVIGTPFSTRQIGMENIIGVFLSSIVLRSRCNQDTTFKELLTNTRGNILDANEYQELPLEKLIQMI